MGWNRQPLERGAAARLPDPCRRCIGQVYGAIEALHDAEQSASASFSLNQSLTAGGEAAEGAASPEARSGRGGDLAERP